MGEITIIGAGIGGLTTAIALKQKGFEVEIFETTPEFKKAGAGINLALNAMQVYKRLGVYDDILKNANHTPKVNLRTKKMSLLVAGNLQTSESEFGVNNVAIHRAKLHQILIQHLGDTKLNLNKRLRSLTQTNELVTLNFEDGTSHNSEVVIGADGIHSIVRQHITADSELRDAEQICWRGISSSKIDQQHLGELNEMWGNGNRFGFVHISQKEIYWFAVIRKNKLTTKAINLLESFSDYHSTVHKLIKGTPKEKIICNEIWDLDPINKWYKGHICLLGDAAHATTPNMGQGACQAIESAMALSICLEEESNFEKAFYRYQSIRKEKANHITNMSWKTGKMAQINNPVVAILRNLFLKMTPSSVMEKQNRKVFALNY